MIRPSRSRSTQSSSVHPPPQPTEEGSSEIQSQPARTEIGGIGSSSNPTSGKKRTRGSSRGIKLFNRRPDDKLIVQFNAEGQPIGDNARPFATLCGIIVRTSGNAPLQVTKWADVPEQSKEKMWKHIQVFVRDFVPSALAFLMNGEPEIVKHFLLKTLYHQGWEKRIDRFKLGEGAMPASFKVLHDPVRKTDTLIADFGESAIGRVAPVDSGFWWIILLRCK